MAAKYMDYRISSKPLQIIGLKVEKSMLEMKSLTILDVGYLPGRTSFRRDAVFMNKWAVIFIAGGAGTYQVNDGEKQQVKANSLFMFYPGAVFHYGPDPGGFWDEYYFTIEGPRIQEWLDSWLFESGTVQPVQSDEDQQNKIERIFMLMDSGVPINVDRAAMLLESLLFEFMMHARSAPQTHKNEDTLSLLDDIAKTLYRPFQPEQLCTRHHISISTLKRTVKKVTGYPLHEYVHRLKVAEAKKLLISTERTFKVIATALGYRDVFYFSRLFKKYAGMSPRHYKMTNGS
ncbi:MAG: transcriptional regulator [Paenibacillus sp.]|nr:transcriptional regulator [Paenibacillus sp.]